MKKVNVFLLGFGLGIGSFACFEKILEQIEGEDLHSKLEVSNNFSVNKIDGLKQDSLYAKHYLWPTMKYTNSQ